jgi:hypothetical protein
MQMLTNVRLADLRLTAAQQRTTGQNLPLDLYIWHGCVRMLSTSMMGNTDSHPEGAQFESPPLVLISVFSDFLRPLRTNTWTVVGVDHDHFSASICRATVPH